ncbi:MAG: hypothetical protein H6557_21610 [Lewinellaceae bacterium]|nr:hypothetical protein [Phaeodactylibacter sp.]MCB9039218.1 hypothetical protein [Lewinellaceae bacterium]
MRTILNCLALVLVLSGCSKFSNQLNGDEKLEALIEAEIQATLSANLGMVSFSELNGFEWSHLLVLAPYSPVDEIGNRLKVDLSSLRHFDIGQRDDVALLVFLDGGKPVRAVAYPRSAGDFAEIEPVLIPRQMTVFPIEAMPNGMVRMRLAGG